MYIVFFIVVLLIILGIIFSKITITIEKIEIKEKNIKFKVKAKLLWFCFLPILILHFNENGIRFLWKNLKYKKMFKSNIIFKTNKKNFEIKKLKKIKDLKIKIDLAKFTLKIGTEDIFITTFLVTIISILSTEIFKKTMKNISNKKMNYVVLPEFNKNEIYFDGKTNISFKILNLKNFILK